MNAPKEQSSRYFSFDFGGVGGVSIYSIRLVDSLNQLDHIQAERVPLVNIKNNDDQKRIEGSWRNQADLCVPSAKALFDLLEIQPSDTIIAHDASTLRFLARVSITCRLWVILHGDYDYYYNTALRYSMWADRTIAVNQNLQDVIQKMLAPVNEQIDLLTPIVRIDTPTCLNKEPNHIIFVGRLEESKGAHLLPQIDQTLQNEFSITLNWSIVYAGTPRLENDDFFRWADSEKHRISVLHQITQKEIFDLYGKAQYFLLPSLSEGHPLSLIEALGHGCIPILYNYSPSVFSQIPKDFEKHVVSSAHEICKKLAELILNPTLAKSKTETARDFFLANHGPMRAKEDLSRIVRNSSPSKRKTPLTLKLTNWERRWRFFQFRALQWIHRQN